jgi:hypothetical protein
MISTEDILAEYAEGFLDGSITAADLITKYDIKPGSELEALLLLAERLGDVLVKVAPTPEFVAQLRRDLLKGDAVSLVARLRQLHPSLSRRQLAAGIGGLTVAAGFAGLLWYAHRSGYNLRPRHEAPPVADGEAPAFAT